MIACNLSWLRRARLFAFAAALGLVLCSPASGASFKFAWLSDTHIGSSTAAEDLNATVQEINSIADIAFVVVSGDVTEYGTWDQLRSARKILDGLKVPSYVLPGNHDTKWSESGATDFSRIWKEDRFVFEHQGIRFIGLHQGPLMKMGDGHWAPQDVRWLQDVLQQMENKEQPIVFVTHYPIDPGIANWYVVLEILKKYNVQAVLCGHGHGNRKLNFEGIPGVMGRSNLRAKQEVGGYNIVELTDSEMTFTERNPGRGAAGKPWHTLRVERREFDTRSYPRPDYSINESYPQVRPRWVFNTGFTIASTPAVQGGRAIVGDASGRVFGISLDSGEGLWTNRTEGPVYSTPAVSGRLAVVASTDGSVYGLDTARGQTRWRHRTPRPIVASPVIGGGRVFIGSSEGKFRALNLATGEPVWEFSGIGNYVETRPLLYKDKVIFGAWDEHLYALSAATGELVWKWKGEQRGALLSPAACWPVAAHGKVFVVAPDRKMTAIESATGDQVWRTGEYVVRESIGLSEDQTRFYVRAMNDFIYAFSTRTSEPSKLWERNAGFGYDINSAMLVEKAGTVFYGTKNGVLLALRSTDGEILWQHKIGPGIVNTVVPLNARRVLATDFDGRVVLVENRGK
jgi:outer membrane protein assembly factor BamB/predicted MPP superfamily phosphohydrolase